MTALASSPGRSLGVVRIHRANSPECVQDTQPRRVGHSLQVPSEPPQAGPQVVRQPFLAAPALQVGVLRAEALPRHGWNDLCRPKAPRRTRLAQIEQDAVDRHGWTPDRPENSASPFSVYEIRCGATAPALDRPQLPTAWRLPRHIPQPPRPVDLFVELDRMSSCGPPILVVQKQSRVERELGVVFQHERCRIGGIEESPKGFPVADRARGGAVVDLPVGEIVTKKLGIDRGDALAFHTDPSQVVGDRRPAVRPTVEVDDVDRELHMPPAASQPGGCRAVANITGVSVPAYSPGSGSYPVPGLRALVFSGRPDNAGACDVRKGSVTRSGRKVNHDR